MGNLRDNYDGSYLYVICINIADRWIPQSIKKLSRQYKIMIKKNKKKLVPHSIKSFSF